MNFTIVINKGINAVLTFIRREWTFFFYVFIIALI